MGLDLSKLVNSILGRRTIQDRSVDKLEAFLKKEEVYKETNWGEFALAVENAKKLRINTQPYLDMFKKTNPVAYGKTIKYLEGRRVEGSMANST